MAGSGLLRAIAGKVWPENKVTGRLRSIGPYINMPIVNSEKAIQLEGTITMVLPGTMFRVALANDHLVLAHISGKMRKRFIRLTIGDRVRMEMSPYDTAKARIVYRL
jgi:translation initiation factor IF-1